jgi:hypothetical protein
MNYKQLKAIKTGLKIEQSRTVIMTIVMKSSNELTALFSDDPSLTCKQDITKIGVSTIKTSVTLTKVLIVLKTT